MKRKISDDAFAQTHHVTKPKIKAAPKAPPSLPDDQAPTRSDREQWARIQVSFELKEGMTLAQAVHLVRQLVSDGFDAAEMPDVGLQVIPFNIIKGKMK